MAHVFQQLILPHIVDRPTRVYFENLDYFKNLDWGEAEPEELGRAFPQLIKVTKSAKGDIFCRKLRDSNLPFPGNYLLPTNCIIKRSS